jgi:hypothetical protein
MKAFRMALMAKRWYAIEVDLDSSRNREAIETLVSEGTIVAFTQSVDEFAAEMDLDIEDITIVEQD